MGRRILTPPFHQLMHSIFYQKTTLSAATKRCFSSFNVTSTLLKMTNTPSSNAFSRKSINKLDVAGVGRPTAQSSGLLNLTSQDEFPSLSDSMSFVKGKSKIIIDQGDVSEQKSSKEVDGIGPSQTQPSVSVKNQTKVENVDSLRPQLSPPENHESLSPYKQGEINNGHGEPAKSQVLDSSGADLKTRTSLKSLQPHHKRREAERRHTFSPPGSDRKKYISPSERRRVPNEYGEANASLSSSHLGTSVDEYFDICSPDTQRNASRRSPHANNMRKWVPKLEIAEKDEYLHSTELEMGEEVLKILRPGMLLLKSYIPLIKQVEIVKCCQELGCGPGGFYRPGYKDGAKLRLYMMCLGQDWNAHSRKYGKIREHDNAVPPEIPPDFVSLIDEVLDDCHAVINEDLNTVNAEGVLPRMSPDVCIVNFYNTNGRLGLHQDRDESHRSLQKGLPVVSLSIGDSAEFLYGDDRDVDKAKSVLLKSGDVLIFGGESRHIFHGVTTIYPKTAPLPLLKKTNLRPGRLNLTFRKY